jgi:hypothetical protein
MASSGRERLQKLLALSEAGQGGSVFSGFPLSVHYTETKGNHVHATTEVKQGELV